MKKIGMLLFALIMTTSFVFALPNNDYRVEEQFEWAVENLEFETMDGVMEENSLRNGSSGRIYTQVHVSNVQNHFYVIGYLRGKCWWEVNDRRTIDDYGVSICEATTTQSFVTYHAEVAGQYLVTPSNARITLKGYFAEPMGSSHVIHQYYNLLGSGSYTFAHD